MAHLTITADDTTGLVERVAMLGLDATTGDPPRLSQMIYILSP